MPGKLKFRVVHATSADEQFPAAELNSHTPQTRGWCSARFCEYPQELVVQLEAPALVQQLQILSHEAKISTRIELFIGEPGASSDFRAAKFKRLGHLSLDSNERSSYQARELKSVHINTRAAFVKLVLHKCYLNKMNLFNQVGIIALSFVGDVGPADSVSDLSAPVSNPSRVNPGQQIASNQPAADLMMDITLDEYVSQRIRELTRSKDAAVAREDYDEAKKIKDSLGTLKDLGIQLAKLELQKKRAVQREDYDTAKNLKVEIDNLRNVVDQISSGLRTESLSAGSRQQPASRQQPSRALQEASVPSPAIAEARIPSRGPSREAGRVVDGRVDRSDVRPPVGDVASPSRDPIRSPPSRQAASGGLPPQPPPARVPEPDGDDRPLPALVRRQVNADGDPVDDGALYPDAADDDPGAQVDDAADPQEAEPLSAAARKEAGALLDAFGEELTRMVYSKTWTLREAGLNQLIDRASSPVDPDGTSLRGYFKAIEKAFNDKIAQVFQRGRQLLEVAMKGGSSHSKQVVQGLLEPVLGAAVSKCGDANANVRRSASDSVAFIARHQLGGPGLVIASVIRSPEKLANPKLLVGRLQILAMILTDYQISQGINVESVMQFCVSLTSHSSGDVRNAATRAIVCVYRQIGPKIDSYLKGVKDQILQSITTAMESADAGRQYTDPLPGPSAPREAPPAAKRAAAVIDAAPKEENGGQACQFCLKKDPSFKDDAALDLHFVTDCTMLCDCEDCGQVVEIATLNEHRLTECEKKFKQCSTCGEAFVTLPHQPCVPSKPTLARCPLCHTDIAKAGFKKHISNCSKNKRAHK